MAVYIRAHSLSFSIQGCIQDFFLGGTVKSVWHGISYGGIQEMCYWNLWSNQICKCYFSGDTWHRILCEIMRQRSVEYCANEKQAGGESQCIPLIYMCLLPPR